MVVRLDTANLNNIAMQVANVEGGGLDAFIEGVGTGLDMIDSLSRIEANQSIREQAVAATRLKTEQIKSVQIANEQKLKDQRFNNSLDRRLASEVYGMNFSETSPVAGPGGAFVGRVSNSLGIMGPLGSPASVVNTLNVGTKYFGSLKTPGSGMQKQAAIDVSTKYLEALNFKLEMADTDQDSNAIKFASGPTEAARVMQYITSSDPALVDAARRSLRDLNNFTPEQIRQFELTAHTAIRRGAVKSLQNEDIPGMIKPGTPVQPRTVTPDQLALIPETEQENIEQIRRRLTGGSETNKARIDALRAVERDQITEVNRVAGSFRAIIVNDIFMKENAEPGDVFTPIEEAFERAGGELRRVFNTDDPAEDSVKIVVHGLDETLVPEAVVIASHLNADDLGVKPRLVGLDADGGSTSKSDALIASGTSKKKTSSVTLPGELNTDAAVQALQRQIAEQDKINESRNSRDASTIIHELQHIPGVP